MAQPAFYWGEAENRFFGGHTRKHELGKMSGRYIVGYRHWIEGCLRHGAKLYIGKLDAEGFIVIDAIQNYLIVQYGSEMNKRVRKPANLKIENVGDGSASIRFAKPVTTRPFNEIPLGSEPLLKSRCK